MMVKELIETLKNYDENTEILIEARDSGGSYCEALELWVRQGVYDKEKQLVMVDYNGENTHYHISDDEINIISDKIILL